MRRAVLRHEYGYQLEQIGQRNPPAAARALPATRNPQLAAVFTVEHWGHEVVTSHSLYKVCNKKTRYEGGRDIYIYIYVESQLATRIVDSTSASDGERAVHHFAHSAGAPTLLGVDVHDSNAGVQQRRNQVQTHVITENAHARIVATSSLQGGLERRVLASVVGGTTRRRWADRSA